MHLRDRLMNGDDRILRATILGCGSSGGVPRPGGPDGSGDWGKCDPEEPRNHRTRCSLLIERANPLGEFPRKNVTSVLVDTSPDFRQQALRSRCVRFDAVLFSHNHADQTHGIDDLRAFVQAGRQRIPAYIDARTGGEIVARFAYCFNQRSGSPYPPLFDLKTMPDYGVGFGLEGPSGPIPAMAFLQGHGGVDSLGFRFGPIAYSSDVVSLPEQSFELLTGIEVWIVDALQLTPHQTHAHLDLTLDWIGRVRPKRAILTNLHISMDYAQLKAQLPDGVEPAYDGMVVEVKF